MKKSSQIYLGTPNAAVLCVDGVQQADSGRMITAYVRHAYRVEPLVISLTEHMLSELEAMFDEIRFPHRTSDMRSLRDPGERKTELSSRLSSNGRSDNARRTTSSAVRSDDFRRTALSAVRKIVNDDFAHTSISSTVNDDFAHTSISSTDNGRLAKRVVSDDELLGSRGKLATFIIRVQQRQNCEWQGRVTWEEKDLTTRFNTVSELLRIIDNAIDRTAADRTWPEHVSH